MKQYHLLFIVVLIFLFGCRSADYGLSRSYIELERVMDEEYHGDRATDEMIKPYREKLEAQMNQVIGELTTDLTKAQPESTLGNWLADMIYDEVREVHGEEVDFALQNQGSIRVPQLAAGPITRGEVFEIMPFDNKITILTMKGDMLQESLDHIAMDGGWPICYSLSMTIADDKATDVMINGEPIDMQRNYTFALPDYVANVNEEFLKNVERRDLDVMIRDLYIAHIQRETAEGKTQSAKIENRIKIAGNE